MFTILSLLSYKFFFNKWIGYEAIPNTFIFDEHDYPFVGYSFRKTGVPTGWSTMEIYKELDDKKDNSNLSFDGISINTQGQKPNLKNKQLFNYPVTTVIDVDIGKGKETIRIVQPFFDHPIFGSWLYSLPIKNIEKFDDIKPSDYRKVSLIISVITGFSIFLFSFLLFKNYFISFLSFFLYSNVPEFVLMSRFALFENILIPLSLITFSLIILFNKYKSKYIFLLLAGLFAGLSFITKESGIFIFLTGLIFLVKEKINKKTFLSYIIPFVLISISYYIYMYYLSPDLFFKLLFSQAHREWFGSLSFFHQIIQPNFSGFPKSGYWLFGIISIFILSIKNYKKYIVLLTPFIIYLFIFLFLGGLNYPWYYLPFLPFIIIASSVLIYNLVILPNLGNFTLFFLLVFSSSFFWGYSSFHDSQKSFLIYRILLLFFTLIFFIRKKKVTKFYYYIWLTFVLMIFYQVNKWNQQSLLYMISNWGNFSPNLSFPL
ncbi:MAG TPA: glycosyltransferase family 39 protein [Candidatus Woesebacteria bacterium]|nr:glycosyltransferase family 39 protein [Candidatus Woesebacteria bacterium]